MGTAIPCPHCGHDMIIDEDDFENIIHTESNDRLFDCNKAKATCENCGMDFIYFVTHFIFPNEGGS